MCHRLKDGRNIFFVSETCHPQNIEVVQTRAKALGIEIVVGSHEQFSFTEKVFGALVQYPDTFGAIHDYSGFAEKAHAAGSLLAVATDMLALTLIKPPGEFGADIAIAARNALACRWVTAARTPRSSPRVTNSNARCRAASSASRRIPAANPRCASRSARANSTSAAKRHQQHLHRAGIAREHGFHVCRLSRPRKD